MNNIQYVVCHLKRGSSSDNGMSCQIEKMDTKGKTIARDNADAKRTYLNGDLTDHELVNEIFEPFEQVSQVQVQLLGATFEMLSGGPAQTHVGIGGGGSSSDMPWGEKKNDNNASRRRR